MLFPGDRELFDERASHGLAVSDRGEFLEVLGAIPVQRNRIGNTLQLHEGFAEWVIAELQQRGHEVAVGEGIFGSANMILIKDDGTNANVGVESASVLERGAFALGRSDQSPTGRTRPLRREAPG